MATAEDTKAGIPDELLDEALVVARRRAADLDDRIAKLSGERDAARRELELLEELRAVRRGEPRSPSNAEVDDRRRSRRSHPAVVAAIAELEKAGRPLHISELMEALRGDDVPIPGSGQPANLIAHLTRNPEVVRPSRGMYALASWGLDEQQKVRPAVRRRMRGKSKGATRRAG
jgi:hypothetical protein